MGAGIVLGFFFPWRLFPTPWLGPVLGGPLVVAGVTLAAWAVRAAGEVDLDRSDSLVARGPYAFSRNPMYLAWTILYLGIAFVLSSGWLMALLPAVILLTHLVILREEAHMDARLGEVYREHRARVRRYL
jgi:protein-S-isoprenylcysteine O-methyltransferase Ste14